MANLAVTIQESIQLNGWNQGYTHTQYFTGIENIYANSGTLPVGTSCILYTTATSSWYGNTLDLDSIRFMRVTNMSTASVAFTGSISGSYSASVSGSSMLRLQVTGPSGNSGFSLGPGDSFILTRHSGSFQGNHPGIGGGAVYRNITGIKATAQGGHTTYQLRAYGAPTGSTS
tara:strand:+ start:413 stop:931 length:519 start_codon:yes stop_codon:yes gene_type:complete